MKTNKILALALGGALAALSSGCPKKAECGNGMVDTGEQCDDGNTTPGDGCSATCTTEGGGACGDGVVDTGESCDDGNTTGGDGCSATCQIEGGAGCGDGVVNGAEECDDANTDDTDDCPITCVTAFCGDGYVQSGVEDCDDADTDDTDGCLATCVRAACGDGLVHAGVEACDDGNTDDTDDCLSDCAAAACGDGVVETGVEACDDGDLNDGDGCDSNCTPTSCGNGIQSFDEACDDGNLDSGDGCSLLCVPEVCGDGVTTGAETCDDGNTVSGDCCSATCTLETTGCACNDGTDDDGDAVIDFPNDPGCTRAADDSESEECLPGLNFFALPPDGHWTGITQATSGFLSGSCAGFGPGAGEDVFAFSVPANAVVTATTALPGTTIPLYMFILTACDDVDTEVACQPPFGSDTLTTPLGPGVYYLVVDLPPGFFGAFGYELQVGGILATGSPCDPADLLFFCDTTIGDACAAGPSGSFCSPAACNNGVDDDADLVADYPAEPGCTGPSDDDETDPAPLPACANGLDDDGDALTDWPADPNCAAASADSEACTPFGSDTFGYAGCAETVAMPSCPDISAVGAGISLGDDDAISAPLGFSFDFYGTAYTDALVGSNGKLFTSNTAFGNVCLSDPGAGAMLATFWDDLYPPAGGSVTYLTSGVAGSQVFEVQWNIQHYAGSPSAMDVRAVLEEATGDITVCYVSTVFGTGDDAGASATAGIQDGAGDFLQYSCNTPVLTDGLVLHYTHP